MKNLGYANGWGGNYIDKDGNPTDQKNAVAWKDKEPAEVIQCRELGHMKDGIVKAIDTRYGDHRRECPVCQIKWGWDSGD